MHKNIFYLNPAIGETFGLLHLPPHYIDGPEDFLAILGR
jgi:hypothetical protein